MVSVHGIQCFPQHVSFWTVDSFHVDLCVDIFHIHTYMDTGTQTYIHTTCKRIQMDEHTSEYREATVKVAKWNTRPLLYFQIQYIK